MPLLAQRGQVLDAGDLIARCDIVFGQLGFDDHLRIELARDDEVWSLIEPCDPLVDELRDRIAMTGEWPQTAKSLSSAMRNFGSTRERRVPLRNVCPSP